MPQDYGLMIENLNKLAYYGGCDSTSFWLLPADEKLNDHDGQNGYGPDNRMKAIEEQISWWEKELQKVDSSSHSFTENSENLSRAPQGVPKTT